VHSTYPPDLLAHQILTVAPVCFSSITSKKKNKNKNKQTKKTEKQKQKKKSFELKFERQYGSLWEWSHLVAIVRVCTEADVT